MLTVQDDGRGFDAGDIPAGHMGLEIMQNRLSAIGATLEIESQPGGGTRITAIWMEAAT